MAANYVKFQRGSQAAYDALKTAGKLDENTLYFIYADENKSVGALYMGTRIISGGDITIASASLDDLADVVVAGAGTDSFLVKDGDVWKAKSLEDVVSLIKEEMGEIAAPAQVFQVTASASETDEAAIERIVASAEIVAGDIVVLKRLITDEKYEYTAYVHNGTAWVAMDGNYNATSVYFDTDLTLTANVGVQEIPSSGSLKLATTGKNVKQVLDMLFASRKLPSKVAPAVTVTSAASKSYEVGSTVAPTYEAVLSAGSYTYGPATGVTAKSWSVVLGEQTLTTASGTFDEITIEDSTNIRVAATATYEAGAAPKDNLGEVVTDSEELATCQIQGGAATGYGNYIKGFRKLFYASKSTPVELNSANIRTMSNAVSTTSSVKMSILAGAKQVVIAVPVGRKVTKVEDAGAFGTDIFSEFTKTVVSVGGADATTEAIGDYAKDYNVYVYAPATALGANTYTVTVANE